MTYLATVAVFSLLCGYDPIYQLLSGGLILGAFFMATDYVTSPTTEKGKLVFGIGLGVITCLIRFFGTMNEGVSFAILLMNLLVPYIEVLTRQDLLGISKPKKNKEVPRNEQLEQDRQAHRGPVSDLRRHHRRLWPPPTAPPPPSSRRRRRRLPRRPAPSCCLKPRASPWWRASSRASPRSTPPTTVWGTIITSSDKGYSSTVVVMVAFDPDGTIKQVKIQSQGETAGVGTKIENESFWSQYTGLPAETITLDQQVDRITGASISSSAVNDAVNFAIAAYNAIS